MSLGGRSHRAVAVLVVAAVVAAAAVIVLVVRRHAANPAALAPTGVSTQRDTLALLAGSDTALVYGRIHRLAGNLGPGEPQYEPMDVVVRSRTGSSRVVTTIRQPVVGWSLVGSLLTVPTTSARGGPVDWWDLRTGRRGSVTLPRDGHYLSAAPHGVLSMDRQGVVSITTTDGLTTVVGSPFPQRPFHVSAAANAAGVVIGGVHGEASYLSFAAGASFRDLQPGRAPRVTCTSLSTSFASCLTRGGRWGNAALVPLDGSAPTSVNLVYAFAATTSGDRLVWVSDRGRAQSLAAGQSATEAETGSVMPTSLVRAYGAAVGLTEDCHSLVEITSARHVTQLVSAPRSAVTTATFSATQGRVATIDDLADPAHPESGIEARSWPLSADGTLGSYPQTTLVGAGTHAAPVDVNLLAASGDATAYADVRPGAPLVATVHVVTPHGTTIVPGVHRAGPVLLSRNWLIYERAFRGTGIDIVDVRLRNLTSGRDIHLTTAPWVRLPGQGALVALSTRYAVYISEAGTVVARDLETGRGSTVAAPTAAADVAVFTYGDYVGWETVTGDAGASSARGVVQQLGGRHPPLQLTDRLIRLTEHGAITERLDPQAVQHGPAFDLHRYAGCRVELLPPGDYLAPPQLVGWTVVWINDEGTLQTREVNPADQDAATPRSCVSGSSRAASPGAETATDPGPPGPVVPGEWRRKPLVAGPAVM